MRKFAVVVIAVGTALLGLIGMEGPASAAGAPTVTALSPAQGPTTGQTAVAITGSGFTGVTSVDFGSTAATLVVFNSDTSITAYTPAESSRTVDVTVTTAGGTSAISAADQYTFVPAPVFLQLPQGTAFGYIGHSCGGIQEQSVTTGFDPSSGFPVGQVYVSTRCGGSGRGGGGGSTLYSAWTNAQWDLTGQLVTSSAGTAPGSVNPTFTAFDSHGNEVYDTSLNPSTCTTAVTTCNFKAYLLLSPSFTPQPRLTGISVDIGPSSGGTSVTISGTGFSGATAVDFGSTPAASYSITNDDSITAVSPAAPAGTVDITVTTAGGANATGIADQFTFVAPPVITGISPNSGSDSGGYYVTVSGQNFTHTTGVSVSDTVTAFVVVSDTELSVYIPGSDSGPDGASVVVTTVGGTASVPFTYTAPTGVPPTITSAAGATFVEGIAGDFTVTATGSPAPTFIESGALPTGVTFSSTGDLSGTPTQLGDFPITIDATNGVAPDATQSFTLTVSPTGTAPNITSADNATFTQGTAGSFQVTATGNPTPTFTETGALPTGVTFSSTGLLLSNATQAGTFPITIDATNGVAPDATQSFTLTVSAGFQISTSSLPDATLGAAYGPVQLQVTGQAPGAVLKWKKAGPLPKGLKLVSATGVLQGTPSVALAHGTIYQVPVRVTEKYTTIVGTLKTKHVVTVVKTLTVFAL